MMNCKAYATVKQSSHDKENHADAKDWIPAFAEKTFVASADVLPLRHQRRIHVIPAQAGIREYCCHRAITLYELNSA